jgi:hypothetical protein
MESTKRPDVIDWGIVGENAALRGINTQDLVDLERYWKTEQSIDKGLMVDDIDTMEELVENARSNGRRSGFTFAISGISGKEIGEFQGFVQFTPDDGNALRDKIENTGLIRFLKDVVIWEVSYAKYPLAAGRQVASGVRQGCVHLLGKLRNRELYPRLAIVGCVGPDENPASLQVLQSACFDPIGTAKEKPEGIIRYHEQAKNLDSVWLLNWNTLHDKLRERAAPYLKQPRVGAAYLSRENAKLHI